MVEQQEIPCASCKSWNKERQAFSCKPQGCKELSDWIFLHVPQLRLQSAVEVQVQFPQAAMQYTV